jgi:hypothetical protein
MRTAIPIIILLLAVSAMNVFGQKVSFSYDQRNKKLNIRLGVKINDRSQLQPATLKLFDKTVEDKITLVESKVIPPDSIENLDPAIGLVFNLTNSLIPDRKYEMRIYSAGILWTSFDVTTGLTVTFLEIEDPICNGGIPIVFEGRSALIGASDEAETFTFWADILNYLKQPDLHKNMTVETSMGQAEPLQIESALLKKLTTDIVRNRTIDEQRLLNAVRTGKVTLCLDPINAPAQGVSNIRVRFKNAPFALGGDFIGEEFSWSGAPQIESSDALPDAPDDRKIERNLDLGLSFTSEVKKNAETSVKNRDNVGIVDLRLAPWNNLVKYKPGETVLRRWTPIYLNTNVSTGKITDSTLSLNRVILGTKWEYRFVPSLSKERPVLKAEKKQKKCGNLPEISPEEKKKKQKCQDDIDNSSNFVDYYRLSFKGEHLSDRDFKQKEIAAEIEFQPVWALLNKPRAARWFLVDDEITGAQTTAYKTFGWEIIPKIGFQFGKTYSRRNPAEAVEATDLLKRLYGGIEMNFDVTSRFTLSLKDTLYGRYELKSDRLKNHFKGEIYTRLGNPWRNTTNGFFFSFEKGDAPPFTSTVNVFRFGYRIRSNGWNRFN